MKDVFVHPQALVETADIGEGCRVWAWSHIMAGARVGRHCNIGEHCFIEAGARIGDGSTIKNGNMIWEGVELGEGVFVGPHVFFTNDLYPRSPRLPEARERYRDKHNWLLPTRIGRGASLGAGAIILAGITIGEYALVAAGACLTRDVPNYALVMGAPARIRGWVCRCGQPLRFYGSRATCKACGRCYQRRGHAVRALDSK